ncbi:MFS transporter [Allorhizobium taibaishanense]|uniref:Putative MFS family arabinose efflux permease n=1 Tax=Allorhizobium taibaishanense TaxID=887144 RepID=A0A7W6HM05_9HYPH|nr:MFS transporter [Allorhizobium taibaishanense]MBB4007396.1 putative MFS family arabinose efflux permease [Allorhizobium taibaishanense]
MPVLAVLAVTQIISWGTVGLLAVVGRSVAADLGMDIAGVFAGNSIFYVTMGLASPFLAKVFIRHGTRLTMMAGVLLFVLAFCLLAAARGPELYILSWGLLGLAGAATLTTPAYIVLNEIAGPKARSAIGALMLATGLSSSLFWPLAALLAQVLGWRGTCLVYAGLIALVCLPLYALVLPRHRRPPPLAPSTAEAPVAREQGIIFLLIVAAIALNAFVTFGFSAVLIQLLQVQGLSFAEAVTLGSMLGVIQVGARAVDFLGGGRWDGLTTGLFAGIAVLLAMLLLLFGNGAHIAVIGFIAIYGLGSGALAVARATLPLVFYEKAAFAKATTRIALPLNVISAAAPPLLAGLLNRIGSSAILGLAIACCGLASILLVILNRRRPAVVAGVASVA